MLNKKILFVTGSVVQVASGPHASLMQTVHQLSQRGHLPTVIGSRLPGEPSPNGSSCPQYSFLSLTPHSAHYCPEMVKWLQRQDYDWDLVSCQGVWLHTNRVAADWCRQKDRPYMITAHGNFNPEALRIGWWKKWLAASTFLKTTLGQASCYQALTIVEYRALRAYGIKKPICIIPNGIIIPSMIPTDCHRLLPSLLNGRRICLFLGRLHPIKGIDRLLTAWAQLRVGDEWVLVIAGTGEESYVRKLRTLAGACRAGSVIFPGFADGVIKSAWLQSAEVCVLPSRSEAFPMSVLEGFALSKHALVTDACGLSECALEGAVTEVPGNADAIQFGLERLLNCSPDTLVAKGRLSHEYALRRFSWPTICEQLESVYQWLTSNGPPPPCVRFD